MKLSIIERAMKRKNIMNFWVFVLVFVSLHARADETEQIRSAQQVLDRVAAANLDLGLLHESARQTEVALGKLKGKLYFPTIKSDASYIDSKREPLSPFQSAERKDLFWQLYLESKTPAGVTLSGGQTLTRSYVGQANPVNPQLPYPKTYYQPEFFVEASLNLTQDLLGYVTRRELNLAKTDLANARVEENLLRHKLGLTALSLYYQLPLLAQMTEASRNILADFQKLERSLQTKVSRQLAEQSDLLNIRSLIAGQQAQLQNLERSTAELTRLLGLLLGDVQLKVVAPSNMDFTQHLKTCEAALSKTTYSTELSDEFALLDQETAQAQLQTEIYKRKLWPELSLRGRVVSTGNDDGSYGAGFEEVRHYDHPVYEFGLNFSWQPSPHSFRAGRQAVTATQNTARLQQTKREQALLQQWQQLQTNIQFLQTKQHAADQAEKLSRAQVSELDKQYYRGRISLFELTQQKMQALQNHIMATTVQQERLSNVFDSLAYFNHFQCELTGPL